MTNVLIESYLAENYSKWLRRTQRLCYLYNIKGFEAEDVLQEIMYVIFKRKDEAAVLDMISIIVHDHYSMLDIFISRSIRNQLANINKHMKVVHKVMAQEVDLGRLDVAQAEYAPRYDVYEKQRQAATIICKLDTTDAVKRVLDWKLVRNNALQMAGGAHCDLTRQYRSGLQILQQAITAQPSI